MADPWQEHPWEKIFQRDGRVLTDLLPAFHQAVVRFSEQGCLKLLDLGSGCGRHLVGFSKAGFEICGMDISRSGLVLTQDWLAEGGIGADLVQGDFRQAFPFQGESFQGIFSTQVIHHALIEQIRFTIREIWRVLRPGGMAFITVAGSRRTSVPSREIEPGTFLPLEGDEKGLPHHIFDLEEVRREFSRFEILDLEPRDDGRVLITWVQKPENG